MLNILIAINPSHTLTTEQLAELDGHKYTRIEAVAPDLAATLANLSDEDVEGRYWSLASELSFLANQYHVVILPIGSPAFQFRFGLELGLNNDPLCLDKYYFSHSDRQVIEQTDEAGKVTKKNIFKHKRFFNLRGATLPTPKTPF